MTTFEILNKRFPPAQYALLKEVSDMAGFNRSRSADYVIMSLWPSRGLDLTGIELKSNRSDWLSELKKPSKAENIFQYCDYFYLLTDNDNVAKIEEIPTTWGWMAIEKGKVVIKKEAPRLSPKEISRNFLAALLKRSCNKEGWTHNESIQDRITESFESGKQHSDREIRKLKNDLEGLYKDVKDFQAASGIDLKNYPRWKTNPTKMGQAVDLIVNNSVEDLEKRIQGLGSVVDLLQRDIKNNLEILKEIQQ